VGNVINWGSSLLFRIFRNAVGALSFALFAKGGSRKCRRRVGLITCPQQNQVPQSASPPTLAKNARMGHPQWEWCTQRSLKVGHRPVPRQLGDWAEESRLPMLLTVCIEAGRKTLTHTSWTGLAPVSRKWMSGQAAALGALNDRWLFANLTASSPLREPSFLSARRPPSPLDFYLSWMSPAYPQLTPAYPSAIAGHVRRCKTRTSLRLVRYHRGWGCAADCAKGVLR
jgi:hypothetical protein